MRRAIFVLPFALWSAFGLAQVRLYVLVGTKRVGQAVASQKILADGGKLVQLSMNLAGPNDSTVTVRSESTYNVKGAPVRMFHESITTSPRTRRSVTVTFSKAGANVVEEVNGKRSSKEVPLVGSAPTESPSEFWFIRDMPKVGATDRRYRFNVSSLAWELITSTYLGPKTYGQGTKKLPGYEVKSSQGTALLDSKGLPYKLELGQIKLERVPDP